MRTWTTHSFRLRLVGTASFSAPARGLEEETPPSLGFCAVPAAPPPTPCPHPQHREGTPGPVRDPQTSPADRLHASAITITGLGQGWREN